MARPGPDAWRAAGRTCVIEGRRLFFIDSARDATNAPTMFLLHGFPTSSWDWYAIWPALSREYRLVAPDLLGFGFSDKPARHDYTIHEQADLMEALIERLGLGPLHVLAHDYGNSVAQELLARDNARGAARRWRSVCFLNGGLFPETHRARPIQRLLHGPLGFLFTLAMNRATLAKNLTAVFGPDTPPDTAHVDAFWQIIRENGGHRRAHRLIRYMRDRRQHRERWVGALTDANIPIQLINGSADPVSGAHMVARYRELVREDDIVELPRIGHYPQLEAPQAVVEHYLAFVQRARDGRESSPDGQARS